MDHSGWISWVVLNNNKMFSLLGIVKKENIAWDVENIVPL
jgi:hypothetical protein